MPGTQGNYLSTLNYATSCRTLTKKSVAARATNPLEKTKETQTIEKAKNREALAVNWTDGLYLPIFLEKNLHNYL